MPARSRDHPVLSFTAAALLINAAIFIMMRLPVSDTTHNHVALAACLDLLITIPAIYYLLVVRSGAQPFSSVWPIVLLCGCRALFLVPRAGAWKPVLAGVAEASAVGFVAWRLRRGAPAENPILRAIAWELTIFQQAFAPARGPGIPAGAEPFTIHRESGFTALLGVAIGASIVEAAGAHLIVQRWSGKAAWLLTAASIYGAVWLLALCRSFVARPVLLSREELLVRKGLLWSLRIPREAIGGIDTAPLAGIRKSPGYLAFTAGCEPKLLLTLKRPLTAEGPWGIRRQVTSIGLSVDHGARFSQLLQDGFG